MKMLFSSITYGPTEPIHNKSLRAAIMHAANHGITWVGDISPNRMRHEDARNRVVEEALEFAGEADGIAWADSDMLFPVDALTKLTLYEKDFITGIYTRREPPYTPNIANLAGDKFAFFSNWPANVLAPIDGCGFGCVITSLKLLRAMKPPYFVWGEYSDDLYFCKKVKETTDIQLYVDTSIECAHLGEPKEVTVQTYREYIACNSQN